MLNKKVLVTGGTGFIGNMVVDELLLRGYEVHLIVYPNFVEERKNIFQHKVDLLNFAEVNAFFEKERFEKLIHLAWYVGAKCHIANVNLDWLTSSLNILNNFQKTGGKVFTGAGTISEYDFSYGFLQEEITPLNSGTLHGDCKANFFKTSKTFCKQNNISFKWPRIFNLYGPKEKEQRLMPSVINSCLNNEDVKVSDCLKFQDYLYVKDTARGIVDVFESDIEGAINICSAQPVQLKTIVEKIAELTNFDGQILWGAIPSAFENNIVVGNNDKLKSIGWKSQYNLESGLIETINWWKNNYGRK